MSRPSSQPPAPDSRGLGSHALSGTGWSAFQGVANKMATMASTLLLARFLGPGDYGVSALVLGIAGFLLVLPPLVMGDVLISHQRHLDAVQPVAWRMVLTSSIASSLVMLLSIPACIAFYPKFDGGTLAALMVVIAMRPVVDAMCVVPLSRLRSSLRFRTIAAIDGVVQLAATGATIALAASGAGPMSLVAPQVASSIARMLMYFVVTRREGRTPVPIAIRRSAAWRRRLRRDFVVAALAQYTHTLISNLPMLFLGRLADQTDTGIYTFAFYLSVQATFVISQQVGSVLQPIFVKLRHDPVRQAKSYLRVIAAIGAVAVPLSLLQAALAEPVLLVLFGPKWSSAVPTFIVLSVGQAFFFAVAPTMAMLRAQGRFRALLVWQVVQLLCSAGAYAAAASRGAVPTAIVDTIAWALAIPIAAWVCVRGREAAVADILRALAGPWLSAIPCAAAAWGCWVLLRPSGLEGALVAVVIVGPALAAASLVAMRFTQPATYLELAPMVGRSARSVARLPQAILSRAFSRGA